MAQPPHFDINGSIYFVTTRLKEKGHLLTQYETEIVRSTILDLAAEKVITLYAYVIMPDHVHLLIKPNNEGISKTMQLLKGRASRKINIHREAKASPTLSSSRGVTPQGRGNLSRPFNLWQKGFFDFTILTDEKFREKFNYIHYNPVKRGLVERTENYSYSSAPEYKNKYGEVYYY